MTDFSPFDFINAASKSKKNIIEESEYPEITEKQYNAYIVNRGFSYFQDTILHANEMNIRPNLYNGAQFKYYLGALRAKNRFSKWNKLAKDETLDMIQEYYNCSRSVAKMYAKALDENAINKLKQKLTKGG